MSAIVIGIGNQKGGVGKTTTTIQLAWALAEMGRKVCVIDMDVNSGATKHLGINPNAYLGSLELLLGEEEPSDVVITKGEEDHLPETLHIIAGHRKLEELEKRLREKRSRFANELPADCLRPAIEKMREFYDYVLVDTPPSGALACVATYRAVDAFVLVAIPEGLAIDGLREAIHDIQEVNQVAGHSLSLLGLALGAVDKRTRLSRELLTFCTEEFGEYLLNPPIPRSTIVPTAQTQKKTIFQIEPNHNVTELYRELAKDFELRALKLTQEKGSAVNG